jgi:hypothetical protein
MEVVWTTTDHLGPRNGKETAESREFSPTIPELLVRYQSPTKKLGVRTAELKGDRRHDTNVKACRAKMVTPHWVDALRPPYDAHQNSKSLPPCREAGY